MDASSAPTPSNLPPVGTTPSAPTGGTTGTGSNSDNVTTLTNDPVDGRSTRGAVLSGDNVMIA